MNWEETIEHRLTEIRIISEQYATAKAQRTYVHEFRHSKKAMLMVEAEQAGKKSVAAQERWAYAHPDYIDLLESLGTAVEQEEKLRWQLELKRWHFEAWRTKQANERAERQRYS